MAEPYRRRSAQSSRPSYATQGAVRVDADFAQEYPDGDAASAEAYVNTIRVGTVMVQELERVVLAVLDAPLMAVTVLAVLDGAGQPLTPSQIAERAVVASSTMTSTLDLLEHRDWVRRVPNPDDRRSTFVEITGAGRATADRILPIVRAVERDALDALTPDERVQFVDMLSKVMERLAVIAVQPPESFTGRRVRPARLDHAS